MSGESDRHSPYMKESHRQYRLQKEHSVLDSREIGNELVGVWQELKQIISFYC